MDFIKLKELAMAAAPGPWSYCQECTPIRESGGEIVGDDPLPYGDLYTEREYETINGDFEPVGEPLTIAEGVGMENLRFIAAANPATILGLIALVERQEAELRAQAAASAPEIQDNSDSVRDHVNGAIEMAAPSAPSVTVDTPEFYGRLTCCIMAPGDQTESEIAGLIAHIDAHTAAAVARARQETFDLVKGHTSVMVNRAKRDAAKALSAPQQPAQAALSADLHDQIMNLPCKRTMSHFVSADDMRLYKEGHRDARHAAAELVAASQQPAAAPVQAAPAQQGDGEVNRAHTLLSAFCVGETKNGQAATLTERITELYQWHYALTQPEAIPAPDNDSAKGSEADLQRVYDIFSIGKDARNIGTLLTNVRNCMHFFNLLTAVEREFFMVPGDPDSDYPDDDPADECLVNSWGSTEEDYIEQFRAALAQRTQPAVVAETPWKWTPGWDEFKGWCTQYFGPDADESYLAEAVFQLPAMAQKFKWPAPLAAQQDAQPSELTDTERMDYVASAHLGGSYAGITSINPIIYLDEYNNGGTRYAIDCMIERNSGRAILAAQKGGA